MRRHFGEFFDFEVSEIHQAGRVLPSQGVVRFTITLGRRIPPVLLLNTASIRSFRFEDFGARGIFRNPGFFDYEAYLQRRGISFTAVVRAQDARRLHGEGGNGITAASMALRARLLDILDARFPSGDGESEPRGANPYSNGN